MRGVFVFRLLGLYDAYVPHSRDGPSPFSAGKKDQNPAADADCWFRLCYYFCSGKRSQRRPKICI